VATTNLSDERAEKAPRNGVLCAWRNSRASFAIAMGKRRQDADSRRFFDEFPCVRISRLRATGVIDPAKRQVVIPFPGGKQKLIGTAHIHFPQSGGWSFFKCPKCNRLTSKLWDIEDRPLCAKCCNGLNIWHRTKWGFGRRERLTAKDKVLDELVAKVDATTPLRFNPPPKQWRGKARFVGNSRRLAARMRRSMVVCRLNQLASQQAAKPGDDGLLRAYHPLAEAAQVVDMKSIWRATSIEALQRALDRAQIAILAALNSADPQQRLAAAKSFLRTKQARERGW
jgi:hypothetical protein